MAHFARVNEDGFVVDVHVVKNCAIGGCIGSSHPDYKPEEHASCGSLDFPEQESVGQEFLSQLWGGDPSEYIQCSYNGSFRGEYAATGMKYDAALDKFVRLGMPEA